MRDIAKTNAAKAALRFVKNGMVVGLGSGTTAELFIGLLAKSGKNVLCIASSVRSEKLARKVGLRVVGLERVKGIDVYVDGADAVDSQKNLLKGGGGCHTREKMLAYSARKFVVIVDESKVRQKLSGPVPLEVIPSAAPLVVRRFGSGAVLRKKGSRPFVTDNGNWVVDVYFDKIDMPGKFECELNCIPGIVENGIFADKKVKILVGSSNGVRIIP